jgi:hypothetical protein
MRKVASLILMLALPTSALPGEEHAADDQPADDALAAGIAKARASYGEARKAFADGLPRGERFLVRMRIAGPDGKACYPILRVRTIVDGTIKAKVMVVPKGIDSLSYGQDVDVAEGEIIDWAIAKADGSEQGDSLAKTLGKMSE